MPIIEHDFTWGQPKFGKLLVLPKSAASQFTYDKPWACISIGCEEGDWPKINKCQQIGLLQMAFADVDAGQGEFILFDDKKAKIIWDFVDSMWDKVDLIMIHCLAGVSRSPAVAAAIAKDYYSDDSLYFNEYCPNRLVYRTMIKNTSASQGENNE
jgi:predicted protein tyrosine phosphatase